MGLDIDLKKPRYPCRRAVALARARRDNGEQCWPLVVLTSREVAGFCDTFAARKPLAALGAIASDDKSVLFAV